MGLTLHGALQPLAEPLMASAHAMAVTLMERAHSSACCSLPRKRSIAGSRSAASSSEAVRSVPRAAAARRIFAPACHTLPAIMLRKYTGCEGQGGSSNAVHTEPMWQGQILQCWLHAERSCCRSRGSK